VKLVYGVVHEKYVSMDNLTVALQNDTYTSITTSGGTYSKTILDIFGYTILGYKKDSLPEDPTDYAPGNPSGVNMPTNEIMVIYLVYKDAVWKDIDLTNKDGSLTDVNWAYYYSYVGTTLTIKKDPLDISEMYRIYQSGSHSVTDIVVNMGVATTITIAGIIMTGRIMLNGNANVTLLLEGTSTITGNIIVVATAAGTASITIDSATVPGSSDGSLTVTSTSNYGAGIGGQGTSATTGPSRNAGTITINGGTVTATGGTDAAGIGGGNYGAGGTININGGTVTSTGGTDAAGIGGGYNGAGGDITITGGNVKATGSGTTNGGAGIGGGGRGLGGTIIINGGTLTAKGGGTTNGGAGIGGGGGTATYGAAGGTINISGNARVTSTGGGTTNGGAGIGGGAGATTGGAGGTITIDGNAAVMATGAGTSEGAAGIGGGANGAGGKIIINGDDVTATGGKNAAGIGGGYNAAGADLTIGGGAEIKAYSGGTLPAIHAASVSGSSTGYYANAHFTFAISTTQTTTLNVYESDNYKSPAITTLSLPANYMKFAFSIPSSVISEDYNIITAEATPRWVVLDPSNSPYIPSGRATGSTSTLVKLVYGVVRERYVSVDNLPVALQSDVYTAITSSGGTYSKTAPVITNYTLLGYKEDSIPASPTDYTAGSPSGIPVLAEEIKIVYFVYSNPLWRDIDLSDADGSRNDANWTSYYSYGGGTLTIKKDPSGINKTYRIYQSSGSHPVTNIIVNTGVTTTITIAGITMTGRITLNGNADVTLLLEGTSTIVGILVISTATATASITIDSATVPGSSDGSLRATSTSNYIAGIGGQGTNVSTGPNRNAGMITINGGTVTAKGGAYAAGIGGGNFGTGGTITINGGTVTVTGGTSAAGIGGGSIGAGGTMYISGGTVTVTGGDYGAGIGGGSGGAGGTINISGGTVAATGGIGGAGIGGGNTEGAFIGSGGNITITDGTVTAIGGYDSTSYHGAAGIGGSSGAAGAVLTIGDDANVKAYSRETTPAIHAASVTGISTGYYVNANFSAAVSATQTTVMAIFTKDDLSVSIGTLDMPANYNRFAFQIPGSAAPEEFNICNVETKGLRQVLRNDNSSPDIPSGRSTGSTSLLVKTGDFIGSAVREIYVDRNNLPAPIQGDTYVPMGLSGGTYDRILPKVPGYAPIGYKVDSLPTGAGDYTQGSPSNINVPADTVKIIYLVYEGPPVPVIIDLADGDGSLTDAGWSSHYEYNTATGTLTIIQDASAGFDKVHAYRIWQSGAHSVAGIIVNTEVTTSITVADIEIAGQITLDGTANLTLLLEGNNTVMGNIVVPSAAALTIDSASLRHGSEGSLTVTPNGASGNGLAGIGGAGNVNIIGGAVAAEGGAGAAGIGGAEISIGSGAEVKAYSDGALPAIFAASISGSGYYVNALLPDAASGGLIVCAAGAAGNTLTMLELPTGCRGFAFQIRGSVSSGNYNIFTDAFEEGVLRVYDSSAMIYSVNSPEGYGGHSGTQGALPVKMGTLTKVALGATVPNGVLPAGVNFAYTDGGTPQVYTAPFYAAEDGSLTVTVQVPAGYEFVRWQDSLDNSIGESPSAQAIDLTAYSATRSAALTAVFAVSGNRVTVTLDSDPAGASLKYAIGALDQQTYTEPFRMERSEILSVEAEATHTVSGDAFLRWESGGMHWNSAVLSNISMPSAPAAAVRYTAVYPDADDTVAVGLEQRGGASAALKYTVNSVPFAYAGVPFTVLKADAVTISVSDYGTHQFIRWYDSGGYVVSNTVTIDSPKLPSYGSSVTFTAFFVDPANAAVMTLDSNPVLSGTFQYRLSGTVSWIGYGGPAVLNKGDEADIRITPASGYTFRFWSDDSRGDSERTYTVNSNVTLTAYFLSDADKVNVTLTSDPAATGTFSWQLPGMISPIAYEGAFYVNKTDNLTITAEAAAGYTFKMWEDSSAAETRSVGIHTEDTVHTAFFLSNDPADRATLTLNSYPASSGTFQYKLSGTVSWIGYGDPVVLNKGDEVDISITPTTGYTFRVWEDGSEGTGTRTVAVNEDTGLTAFFLSEEKITVTLTANPAAAGTLSWQLPGVTAPVGYTIPFVVNKTDHLMITAEAAAGYTFRMWEDSSTAETRSVGARTENTEHTAFFLSNDLADQAILTLNPYPASSGTFQYKLRGTASWIDYHGAAKWIGYSAPVVLNKGDKVDICATAASGYRFMLWEDDLTAPSERAYVVNTDTTLTAHFLSKADKVTITLTSSQGTGGTLYWQLPGMDTPSEYTAPFEINNTDDLTITAAAETGYTFRMWEDSSVAAIRNVGTHIDDTEYTAFFLSNTDKVTVSLAADPSAAGKFSWQLPKMTVSVEYTAPFDINRTDDLTVTAATVSGYTFRMWEDSSTTMTRHIGIRTENTEYTAFFLSNDPAEQAVLTLNSYPASSGTFQYRLSGTALWTGYGGPVTLNKGDKVEIRALATPGYNFRFWGDDPAEFGTRTVMVNDSTALMAYFLSNADMITVTLASVPAAAGTFSWQLPGMNAPIAYTMPFEINKTDNLTLTAETAAGHTFRMWDDSSVPAIRNVGTHTENTEYTAFFLSDTEKVTITLTSSPRAGGMLYWQLPGMDMPLGYTAPFEINKTDDLSIIAAKATGYTFQKWEDASTAAARNVGTHAENTEYTAFFLSDNPVDQVTLALNSYPVSSGTFLYRLSGTASWVVYSAPVTLNKGDVAEIRTTAAAGYSFRFWGDAPAETGTKTITVNTNTALTAFFLSDSPADKIAITITSYPVSSGTFSWQLPEMGAPVAYTIPFEINKTDDLTITAEAGTGYVFRMWNDQNTSMSRNAGTHAGNAEYTAFFTTETMEDRVLVTLNSNIAAEALLAWQLPGMAAPAVYTEPFYVNKIDDLTVIAFSAAGYTFMFWEDISADEARHIGIYAEGMGTAPPKTNGVVAIVEYMAFFLSDNPADRAEITLTSDPAGAGTFRWELPGMIYTILYTTPFEINKTDNLTLTAAAEEGFVLLMWEDSSAAAVRNVGTHAGDAEYTATFELFLVHLITATAGRGGSIDPAGQVEVLHSGSQEFVFVPDPGYKVSAVYIDGKKMPAAASYTFQNVTSDREIHVEFVYAAAMTYYIAARSDDMTLILPEGVIAAEGGTNRTFRFSANEGYRIGAVTVDGTLLSKAETDLGYYTFFNISSDHIIWVEGTADTILEISISEGGYAEYSVDGGPLLRYVSPVTIGVFTEITLRAHTDDGYLFLRWETPTVYTTPEITLDGPAEMLRLDLYFAAETGTDNGSTAWMLAAVALLIAAGLLFVYRRRGDSDQGGRRHQGDR
jgi:hypothetical protein